MKILAIDTSTEACSAALAIDGEVIEKYELAPRQHAELILRMVEQLLNESGQELATLDGLAFGRGPGAFTGVRIATGVIQGLAFGANLPVVPVSSLAALAQSASEHSTKIIPAIDARMGEVYWGVFETDDEGNVTAVSDEKVSSPGKVQFDIDGDYAAVGSGWLSYQSMLEESLQRKPRFLDADCFPRASDIVKLALKEYALGQSVPAQQALPVYLRNQVTQKPPMPGKL